MKTLCLSLATLILWCSVPRADAVVDSVMAAKANFSGLLTGTDTGGNKLLLKFALKNNDLINLIMGRALGSAILPNESLGLAGNDGALRTFNTNGTPELQLVVYDNTVPEANTPVILRKIGEITGTMQVGEDNAREVKRVFIGSGTFTVLGNITEGTLQTATTMTRKPTDFGPIPKITTSLNGYVKLNLNGTVQTMFILKGKISVSGPVLGR